MKLSHLLVASSLLVSASAFATPATVVSVEGQGKIGKDGAWRPLKAGETIGEAEFLSLPPDSTVKVKLGDGTPADFRGKAIVPGRRLATKKAAGALLRFSESLQKAAEAVVGVDVKGTAPGASKADDKTASKKKVLWAEESGSSGPMSSKADFAEAALRDHDVHEAVERADAILKDAGSSSLEKRRAHLILGQVYVEEGEFTKALKNLTAAVAPLTDDEQAAKKMTKGKVEFDPEAYRAFALLSRGETYRLLGDEAKAKADFEATIKAFPVSTQAYKAHFHLGVLALEQGKKDAAEKHFAGIATMKDSDDSVTAAQTRELKAVAMELLQQPNL